MQKFAGQVGLSVRIKAQQERCARVAVYLWSLAQSVEGGIGGHGQCPAHRPPLFNTIEKKDALSFSDI